MAYSACSVLLVLQHCPAAHSVCGLCSVHLAFVVRRRRLQRAMLIEAITKNDRNVALLH